MSRDVLFELGVEELPSAAVLSLGQALAQGFKKALDEVQLSYEGMQVYATPRRLAVSIQNVLEKQASYTELKLGPREDAGCAEDGKPSKALLGFARSLGVSVDDLMIKATDKGPRFAYEAHVEGLSAQALLPEVAQKVLQGLPIAKPMRWGDETISFVRPVHWVVFLWGEDIVETELMGVQAGRNTYGHRYHSPQSIPLKNPNEYEKALEAAYVIADFAKRQAAIKSAVQAAVKHLDATPSIPDDLLEEVTSIVEWPVALCVDFKQAFLDVPPEVLIASMQQHQKCFAVYGRDGKLLPHFVTVSNIKSTSEQHVIQGNERVMHARLSDAEFFYTEDKKHTLESRVARTESVVFQVDLGSLKAKVERMVSLITSLAPYLDVPVEIASRAAILSKSDLSTGMVGEFPELQGIMGYYYALHDNEPESIALALKEQYLPRFSKDALPDTSLGLLLSLVDRLDTLVGIFGVGLKPTGERDPFKLRRHALAVIRILNALPVSLHLTELLEKSCEQFAQFSETKTLVAEVKAFILERMPAFYQASGYGISWIRAGLAKQSEDLRDLDMRLKALEVFMSRPEAQSLGIASKRVNKLLEQADLNARVSQLTIDASILNQPEEKALFERVQSLEAFVSVQYQERAYGAILLELSSLKQVVDAFFEHVMVMDKDEKLKLNRLSLLSNMQHLLQGVVDISMLPETV